jgi:hypothetical protein
MQRTRSYPTAPPSSRIQRRFGRPTTRNRIKWRRSRPGSFRHGAAGQYRKKTLIALSAKSAARRSCNAHLHPSVGFFDRGQVDHCRSRGDFDRALVIHINGSTVPSADGFPRLARASREAARTVQPLSPAASSSAMVVAGSGSRASTSAAAARTGDESSFRMTLIVPERRLTV